MQHADARDGSIVIQVSGDGNAVTITAAGVSLTLARLHARAMAVRKDLDLLNPFTRAIPLRGRDADLDLLEAWLDVPGDASVRCLVGRAGSGKTRLALELCARAEARPEPARWRAGFVKLDEMQRFRDHANAGAWRWPARTLLVVDYAAAKAASLRGWLVELAQRADPVKGPLRILLLERHASPGLGWWATLTRSDGWDEDPAALLDPPAPVTLPSLTAPEDLRGFLADVMARACELGGRSPPVAPPARGVDSLFDAKLASPDLAFEPLYLAMTGVVAAREGVGGLLRAGREDLARKIAEIELGRIGKVAEAWGLRPELLKHLAACVTLTGGAARDELPARIKAEREATGWEAGGDVPALADALLDALGTDASDGVPPVLPDLIGEALTLQALAGATAAERDGIAARAHEAAPGPTLEALIRTAQDFARTDDHEALRLLRGLAARLDLVGLMGLSDSLPPSTLALRGLGVEINTTLEDHFRGLAAAKPDTFVPLLAMSLNTLANRLSALGRRDAALAAAEKAVGLYRGLAAARPDAFRPDLAASLSNLASFLSALGRREAALQAAEEAVTLRRELAAARPDAFRPDLAKSLAVLGLRLDEAGRLAEAVGTLSEAAAALAPAFLAQPQAFAGLMGAIARDYRGRCEKAAVEPDMALLGPIAEAFQRLQREEPS